MYLYRKQNKSVIIIVVKMIVGINQVRFFRLLKKLFVEEVELLVVGGVVVVVVVVVDVVDVVVVGFVIDFQNILIGVEKY